MANTTVANVVNDEQYQANERAANCWPLPDLAATNDGSNEKS
jgi:hypothetical protein